ncbi:MAG: hypothetical protein ACI92I_000111 [Acidimicrobiales bacterium]|jgi:hypothetical protein
MTTRIINQKVYYVDSYGMVYFTRTACIEAEVGYR